MSFYSKFYSGKYKYFLIVPAVLFVLSLICIFSFGLKQSVDLSGGTIISIHTTQNLNTEQIKNELETKFGLEDVTVNLSKGVSSNRLDIQYLQQSDLVSLKQKIDLIKADESQANAILSTKALLTQYNITPDTTTIKDYKSWISQLDLLYNTQKNDFTNSILTDLKETYNFDITAVAIKEISPTLSASFYSKTILVSIIAIIGIILLIFIAYREVIPSVAIIACGILDVLGGLAGMAILGIPISLVSIPALLMLLGYSIDTDIMLTTKLIKRQEGSSVEEQEIQCVLAFI